MMSEKARVGDVLELQRRAVSVDLDRIYQEIGVRSFGNGIFHKEPVSGLEIGAKRVFRIEAGDLVISNVFAWEGAVAQATQNDAERIGSHRFMTFTPKGDLIDTNWARWFFISEPGLALLRLASPGSAGRNRTLAVRRFEELEIPLPPIEEQRRTAYELCDAQIRSVALKTALKRQESAHILKNLPVLTERMIGRLEGASNVDIGALVEFIADTIHPGDDPSPATCFVGLQHVESNTGRLLGSDPLEIATGRKFRFRPGDVLYGYLRPYLNKVWVADRDGLCSVDQFVLRPRDGVDSDLIGYILRSQSVLNRVNELTHNLQLPRIRSGLLSKMKVPEVPDYAVNHLTSELDRVSQMVIYLAERRTTQTALVGALLPAALNEAFADLT